jgi:undecaprenyl diphosphate synthase
MQHDSSDNHVIQRPRHIAVVMDGNGRWATQRGLPRTAGHREGVKAVRAIVETSAERGVGTLTLFAFSSENWRRPKSEVSVLMSLFLTTLRSEVRRLVDNNVRLRFIGERQVFSDRLRAAMNQAEGDTRDCSGLNLVVAANYGGRWDIVQAARRISDQVLAGQMLPEDVTEDSLHRLTCLADLPAPDLFIRTGGERRISNFLIWQLAYTELYFADCLWPDFDEMELDRALADFERRQRRFGRTGEQVLGRVDA